MDIVLHPQAVAEGWRCELAMVSIQEFLDRLNHMALVEGARCRTCGHGNGLLECNGCGTFQHAAFLGLEQPPAVRPLWHARPLSMMKPY